MVDILNNINFEIIFDKILNIIKIYGPKILFGIALLVMGWWAINITMSLLKKLMQKRKIDESLNHFLIAIANIILKVLLCVSVISTMGIDTTSFVAALAAAGFAIGLALQGSLSNFAGGILILIFKPFKLGDYIEAQGVSGTVKKIDIINTIINTPDNKRIIIPNGPLSNDVITNYTAEKLRRVDMVFSISYNDDIDKAKKLIETLIKKDKRTLNKPKYQIIIGILNASSVDIKTRVWVNKENYWDVYFEMQETIKKEFDKAGISIPFHQQDVHIYNHNKK